jgi:hypothetical protein
MSRLIITTLISSLILLAQGRIETSYDEQKDLTTVRLPSTQFAGPKDRYQSLAYSIHYSYGGRNAAAPSDVNFEIVSVVKARRLNTDLYVVFVVDGKEIHFGSSRAAIRNPVPGKPWIGEKMVFHVPREDFLKMAAAKTLGVKLGGVSFEFNDAARNSIRGVAKTIRGS